MSKSSNSVLRKSFNFSNCSGLASGNLASETLISEIVDILVSRSVRTRPESHTAPNTGAFIFLVFTDTAPGREHVVLKSSICGWYITTMPLGSSKRLGHLSLDSWATTAWLPKPSIGARTRAGKRNLNR